MSWSLADQSKTTFRRGFPMLPCGCHPSTTLTPPQVLIDLDGSRTCRHGKKWKFMWVQMEVPKVPKSSERPRRP